MHQTVLIVAGGIGSRMNSSVPKQFLLLKGLPILFHTIKRFLKFDNKIDIRLVLPGSQVDLWKELCRTYNFQVKHQLFSGGKNRFQSVKNGLHGLQSNGLVAVHDGVRPLVSIDTIQRCFHAAEKNGAAVPVVDVVETLREIREKHSVTVNREKFKIVQTPQVFINQILLESYNQSDTESFTDDASVVESAGHPITLIEGNIENIKITKPSDILVAESFYHLLQND